VLKSTDGGATWSAPVDLDGMYPTMVPAKPRGVRALVVQGSTVLAGTDTGLFGSTDGGASFALTDIPNSFQGKPLLDSIWSIVAIDGGFVLSDVHACDSTSGPPSVFFAQETGGQCLLGNDGEIWTSPDGATWTKATLPKATDIGRITLAAGPNHFVYAFVANIDGSATAGMWRSADAGKTWTDITSPVVNPTLPFDDGAGNIIQDCAADLDIAHNQAWYNQAIVVDPTNADHVLIGGNLCGARSLNATSATPTWELVSEWLPNPQTGATANGQLPYVHADWHAALSIVDGGTVRTFAGTDGGMFTSTDVFDPGKPGEMVTWANQNKGLVTHLIYNIASGDPASGDPFVLFGGLQDNGTRFRTDPQHPSVFNQSVGGDGIGCTVHHATTGTTYWASVEFGHAYCQPAAGVDCAAGENWIFSDPVLNFVPKVRPIDMEPFFVHYADVETDATGQSVLTHTDGQVFVSTPQPDGTLGWTVISQDVSAADFIDNIAASRTIPGLYGAVGFFDAYVTTTGNTPATWQVTAPVSPDGARFLGTASSMDFKSAQEFVLAFQGVLTDGTPPPDEQGRLYRTTDGGQSWQSIVGADPAHRLPNVAIYVVKYDPVTPTTIYAGTDLGVYFSIDDAATWNRMGDGLPIVPVKDLYVAKNQDFIRVATYGRGFWEIYPSASANQGTPGNGDFDRNLAIDWRDVGALAARLGETPTTQQQPFYTWILDLVSTADPPLQSIDEADLQALLGKLGGHP
jgi:photosystem II stability/assembly factor-like uncharacterized protein